jgi:hypothetical protein
MRSVNSFSIDFVLRKDKKNVGLGYLFAKVTVNGDDTEISLKEKVKFSEWNCEGEKVNSRSRECSR